MKVRLNVFDRVLLLNILPEATNNIYFGIYQDFLKKLSFTEEELAKYQIFEDGDGRVKWKNSTRKTFDICSKIYDIVCAYLEDCKKKNLLEEEHMELYEKFHR